VLLSERDLKVVNFNSGLRGTNFRNPPLPLLDSIIVPFFKYPPPLNQFIIELLNG